MKRAFISTLVILVFALGISAQSSNRKVFGEMLAPGISMTGLQNAAGIYDAVNDRCWGNIFVLTGSGEWHTVYLTVSMDYTNGLPNPDGNKIVQGTWTMMVLRENQTFLTLYGNVTDGFIRWVDVPNGKLTLQERETFATLNVSGELNSAEKGWSDINIGLRAHTDLSGPRAVTTATLHLD